MQPNSNLFNRLIAQLGLGSSIRLSKSQYIRGAQCPKSLYLRRFTPNLATPRSAEELRFMRSGSAVGELACDLFKGGLDASPERQGDIESWVRNTQQLLEAGQDVIYEAAFSSGGLFAAIDILVHKGDAWLGFEVKSSTGTSERHLADIAFQYHVLSGAGIRLADISLVYLIRDYVRGKSLDVNGLFAIESVLAEARQRRAGIKKRVRKLRRALARKEAPQIEIGPHCTSPHRCDFKEHCWDDVPDGSVLEIKGLHREKAWSLYRSGVRRMEQLTEAHALRSRQAIQVECQTTGRPHVDPDGIRDFLESLSYPLHFMDFETFSPAIPRFAGTRPYQQIPFQYSLHYCEHATAEPAHREFLALAGEDPRRAFVEALLRDTAAPGQIVVYNRAFEAGRLRDLAHLYPAHADALQERIDRTVDLMVPFQRGHFQTPGMNGSYSIKAVLPALVPELSYADLSIGDGGAAMMAYEALAEETDANSIAEVRAALLAYCRLDTLAMVRILEALRRLVE